LQLETAGNIPDPVVRVLFPDCEKMVRRRALLALAGDEEIAEQQNPAGNGGKQNILEKIGPALDAIVVLINSHALFRDQHVRIFQKIDAAFLAFPALALTVAASRTLMPQRCVAAPAERVNLAHSLATLRAVHRPILMERGHPSGPDEVIRRKRGNGKDSG
jgi:hypothetical protein